MHPPYNYYPQDNYKAFLIYFPYYFTYFIAPVYFPPSVITCHTPPVRGIPSLAIRAHSPCPATFPSRSNCVLVSSTVLSTTAVLFGGSAKLLILSAGVVPAEPLVTKTPEASPRDASVIVNMDLGQVFYEIYFFLLSLHFQLLNQLFELHI